MSNTIIKKTIVNFDTRNNINKSTDSTVYNNCIIPMRESYKNVKSLSLKSAELILPNVLTIPSDSITLSIVFPEHNGYPPNEIPSGYVEHQQMHYMVHYNQTQIDFIVPNILTLQSSNTLTLITLIEEINTVISSTTLTT